MAERDGYTYIPSDPPSTSGATLAAERSAYKLRQRPGMHEPRQKHTGFVIPPGPYGADRIDVVTPVAHRPGGQLIAASAGVPHIKRQNSAGNKAIATMLAPQVRQASAASFRQDNDDMVGAGTWGGCI